MINIQVAANVLAFDEDNGLALTHDGVIYFLALLRTDVANKFRNYFRGVKYIIAQRIYERHDQGCFGRFLGFECAQFVFAPATPDWKVGQ